MSFIIIPKGFILTIASDVTGTKSKNTTAVYLATLSGIPLEEEVFSVKLI